MPVDRLFIPLMGQYFDAFADGTKTIEWRAHGPRWSTANCVAGRRVELRRGYSGASLSAFIAFVRIVQRRAAPRNVRDIYPNASEFIAIHLRNIKRK